MNSQKNTVLDTLRRLWMRELTKTLFLMGLFAVSVLIFNGVLVAVLETDYPLHTPISPSMEPTLNIGDLLIVHGVSDPEEINTNPENGDIIIFRDPVNPNGLPIVHRAIEKSWKSEDGKYYFKTKGDNNERPDWYPVPEDYIIGKVIWRIPLLGYTKIFLGTPAGMTIIIIIFLVLLFLEAK